MDRARAFDGTYRASSTGNPKRDFIFTTPPITRQNADLYEYLLSALPTLSCSGDILGWSANMLTFPDDFSNAAWSKQNTTVTPNNTSLVQGSPFTVDVILETVAVGTHGVYRTAPTIAANTLQNTSVFVAPNSRGWAMIQTFDKAGTVRQSWINLTTGALGTVNGGHTITVDTIPGFFQISVTWNSGTGGTTPEIAFFVTTADGVTSYAGDITKGFYLGGARHAEAAVICCPEITGWIPVKTADGHRVVLSFTLHEQ